MKDRILQILKNQNLTAAQFADKIGISAASLSHILNGRNKPSLDVVTKLHQACPDVDLDWLLYGKGSMYHPSKSLDFTGLFDENTDDNSDFSSDGSDLPKNRKEIAVEKPENSSKEIVHQEVKYVEKPSKKITEIRIFFDNGTYETFKPA